MIPKTSGRDILTLYLTRTRKMEGCIATQIVFISLALHARIQSYQLNIYISN